MGFRWDEGTTSSGLDYNMQILMKNDTGSYKTIGFFENSAEKNKRFLVHETFTGQHYNILNKNIGIESTGLIVYSTGKYININNNLNISINESLPICKITNTDNNKAVFGVISDKEDNNSKRYHGSGTYKSVFNKTNIESSLP